jgi:DNA-binding CsgD family transcriptional regulator
MTSAQRSCTAHVGHVGLTSTTGIPYALLMHVHQGARFEFRLPHPLLRPGSKGSATAGSAHVQLNRDVSSLFPYLHTVTDQLLCHADPPRARFIFEGRVCTLFAREISATAFHSEGEARAYVHRLMDVLDDLDARRHELSPAVSFEQQTSVLSILRTLPRTNCGECDQETCMSFAVAVSQGQTTPDCCPAMPAPVARTAVYPVYDREGNLADTVSVPVKQPPAAAVDTAPPRRSDPHHGLTERELQVLELLASGATNPEIAEALGISGHTVKSHVTHIFDKLAVDDRTQAAVLAVRLGLV